MEEQRRNQRHEPPEFLLPTVLALEGLAASGFEVTLLTASAEDGLTVSAALAADEDGVIDDKLLLPEQGLWPRRVALFLLKANNKSFRPSVLEAYPAVVFTESVDCDEAVDLHSVYAKLAEKLPS